MYSLEIFYFLQYISFGFIRYFKGFFFPHLSFILVSILLVEKRERHSVQDYFSWFG